MRACVMCVLDSYYAKGVEMSVRILPVSIRWDFFGFGLVVMSYFE
jgi:hypothetical protein